MKNGKFNLNVTNEAAENAQERAFKLLLHYASKDNNAAEVTVHSDGSIVFGCNSPITPEAVETELKGLPEAPISDSQVAKRVAELVLQSSGFSWYTHPSAIAERICGKGSPLTGLVDIMLRNTESRKWAKEILEPSVKEQLDECVRALQGITEDTEYPIRDNLRKLSKLISLIQSGKVGVLPEKD
jgi:hypothetical protein